MTSSLFFLPGNQLYDVRHLEPHKEHTFVMVEDLAVCTRRAYHQQKLGLVIASMREHAEVLRSSGFNVVYFDFAAGVSIEEAIVQTAEQVDATRLLTFEVTDRALSAVLRRACESQRLDHRSIPDPGFLTPKSVFSAYAKGKPRVQMGHFYKRQRSNMNILLEGDGKPEGGQWSFDADNRRRLPQKQAVPDIPTVSHSPLTTKALAEVAQRFPSHAGEAKALWLPTTRSGALDWLDRFLQERLLGFGSFEDAISQRSDTLFHSVLSPLLNIGLLTPKEVLDGVLFHRENIPLNDLEGFVRQLIGWREFMRGVYNGYGDQMRLSNIRNQGRELAQCWRDGTTGIPPLDHAICTQSRLGWNHHIERLMVISNLMNLCEIKPTAVFDYFMENYIDAYDWVMVPNVYGMGLNSDGGVFATKPYIAGSNYLLKMSDFKKGEWCDVVDGLYWRFVSNNREALQRNPRLGLMVGALDKLDAGRRERIFSAAEQFLAIATE